MRRHGRLVDGSREAGTTGARLDPSSPGTAAPQEDPPAPVTHEEQLCLNEACGRVRWWWWLLLPAAAAAAATAPDFRRLRLLLPALTTSERCCYFVAAAVTVPRARPRRRSPPAPRHHWRAFTAFSERFARHLVVLVRVLVFPQKPLPSLHGLVLRRPVSRSSGGSPVPRGLRNWAGLHGTQSSAQRSEEARGRRRASRP